jgi:hypothetical protein
MYTEYQNTYTSLDQSFERQSALTTENFMLNHQLSLENTEFLGGEYPRLSSMPSKEFELTNNCAHKMQLEDAETKGDSNCQSVHFSDRTASGEQFLIFSGSQTPIHSVCKAENMAKSQPQIQLEKVPVSKLSLKHGKAKKR